MSKAPKHNVVAVVVTYNRVELLIECLKALDSQNCDVLIIDNASTDGTKDKITKVIKNPKYIYENTGKNLGGAGGFNYGMKRAVELGYKYIWLMDDDCIVHENSLSEFMKADKELGGNYGFLSGKVLWKDGSLCVMNKQKKTFSRWLKDFDTNYQTIALGSFVSFFIKSETVKKYGLPIKEFFIWTDDWEYARRISRREKCYFISSSIVTHKCKENIGASIATADDRMERFRYLYRNDCVLYRREGIKGWILFKLRIVLHKLRILKSNKSDKNERVKIIDDAIKEGKKFSPAIEYVHDGNQKIKVVEFFCEPLNYGGQEAFIKNVYAKIDKSKFAFTFITPFECENTQLREMIKTNNDELISDRSPFNSRQRKRYILKTARSHLDGSFDVIHIHSGSTVALCCVARVAKKCGIKKVIVHSHSVTKKGIKSFMVKLVTRHDFIKNVDYYLACSMDAGKSKFPSVAMNCNKFYIVKNGIDPSYYKFDKKTRKEYREKYSLQKKHIVINIGRYSFEKNQLFILDIFDQLIKIDEDSILVLVGGQGELLNEIKQKIKDLKLENRVLVFLNRSDVKELLDMSDVFILPSLWEGFPFTGIEAQANGIPCLFSDRITDELAITDSFNQLSLDKTPLEWARSINQLFSRERLDNTQKIRENGYDICNVCSFLEGKYEG